MAKRVKKKVKSGQKEKRAVPTSKTPVPESNTNIETSDAVVLVVKDRSGCSHLHKNFDLGKVSSKFRTSVSLKCEDCREESTDRRGGKGKGKHGKKKGGSADIAVKAIWVCLECGHFSCGGDGLPTTPQSHAVRHARQRGHPLAIQYKNPHLRWCFPCSTLIPVDNSEENGESKDILADIVKVIKAEPSEQTSGNVEDIWFGSGSVLGEIKSENSAPSKFNGAGGYVVRGLVNLGNTCFFNSVLQNLMAMDKLRVHFLKMDASVGPLTISLKNLFVGTNPEIGYKTVINPKPLFGCVCSKSPQFGGFHQQDSHELLRCLLDVLSIEESNSRKQTRSSTEKEIPPNPTFVEAIFGGMLCCSVSCLECEHSSVVYEPFLDLSLPIPAKRPPYKKVQPIARPKQKLPSRRSERIRSRFNGYTDSAASNGITDSPNGGRTSSYQVQSTASIADNMTVSSVSSMSSDPFIQTVVGANEVPASQNLQATEGVDSSLLRKTVSEKTIASMDDTSWLDYLELDTVKNDHDMDEQSGDTKETKDTGNADACDNDVLVQKPLESPCVEQIVFGDISGNQYFSTRDAVVGHEFTTHHQILPKYLNLEMDFKSNPWVDETPLQVQNSEVLLLPHKEDTSTNGELLNGEDRVEMDFERNSWEDETLSQVQSSEVLLLPPKEETSTNGELLNGEDRVEMDFERNSWEDETPSQVQTSEVLLLPYKEDISTYATTLNPEDVITTSPVSYEQHSVEFDGFGDLFNEPEVAAGPQSKPLNDESSESDLDEIDNTESPVSVERCLSYFTKPELLSKNEHAWHCENCSKAIVKNRKSRKNIQISKEDASLDEGENGIKYAQFGQNKGHKDGIDERDALDSSAERLVLCNGVGCNLDCTSERNQKSEPHGVAALLGEDKGDISDALLKLTCNQDSSNDSCRIGDSDIARCDPSNLQQTESQSVGGDHESPRGEDEQLDSKSIKVKRDAKKRILIDKAPPILTIHLKRFSQDARGRLSKLNGHVGFSDTLDLRPYMHSRFAERENYKYRLLGVVEHLGSMGGGHYVAYIRGGAKRNGDAEKETTDSMWYYASDDYIREVSFEEVLGCEAYILFYTEI